MVNANPNAGRRPNLAGRKPVANVTCPKCGVVRRPYDKTGCCKPCHMKEHPIVEGNCVSCGRWMKLPYRGLCDRCTHVLPPGSGIDCRQRALNAEDAEWAAEHQQAFVEHIVPRVQRLAGRRLWELSLQDRLELITEAVALAWQIYLQERKRGYDPLKSPMKLAQRVVGKILFGMRVTGNASMEDVLSSRRRDVRKVRVVAMVGDYLPAKPTPDAAEEIDRREWLARLTSDDRRVVEFLSAGNNWEDAKAHFGMKTKEVAELLERLWKSSRLEEAAAE
jgi:hypothetical protein